MTEIYLAYIGPDGYAIRLPLVDSSIPVATNQPVPPQPPTVTLRQRRSSGVTCVAVYDDVCAAASLPRLLRVTVGPVDATSRFSMTTDSIRMTMIGPASGASATVRPRNSPSSAVASRAALAMRTASSAANGGSSSSGAVAWDVGGTGVADLDACRSTVTLRHVTAEPDPEYNRQTLRCVANAHQASLSSAASARLNVECESCAGVD